MTSESSKISSAIVDISKLKPEEIAILQFDSRPLDDYWLAAAQWNKYYCDLHHHVFIYYSLQGHCHHGEEPLADAWCKVRAMLNANEDFPNVKLFLYFDSDAVVDKAFEHLSLNEMMGNMQKQLRWNPEEKPTIFNQDGKCWWCELIVKAGYNMCLNAGTVVWYRHDFSQKVLEEWWDAAMDPYEGNPIKRKFRLKWPWEQDRQMAVYNRSSDIIQIASQPRRIYLSNNVIKRQGWCLSHLQTAGCYISHYCANADAKQIMRKVYQLNENNHLTISESMPYGFEVHQLHF